MKHAGLLKPFLLGGTAYVALEMLWRGRSHGSMFLAGGICFLLLGKLEQRCAGMSAFRRALAGAGIITAVELLFGFLFNRSYQVWDYRGQWGNFRGQICPLFSLLWIGAAWLGGRLYRFAAGTF